jgi:hypothetical protein
MTSRKTRSTDTDTAPRKRLIAVGKKIDGRWQVRTSLWRYVAATALSRQ